MSELTRTLEKSTAIRLTPSAVEAVRRSIEDEKLPETIFLRVGVKGGGCSGFSYSLSFDSETQADDRLVEQDGVRLVVDVKSEMVLRGTELDYSSGLNGKGFVFTNPNATGTCGCGNSFSV